MAIFKRTAIIRQQEVSYVASDGQKFAEQREAVIWQLACDISASLEIGPNDCVDFINLLDDQRLLVPWEDWA